MVGQLCCNSIACAFFWFINSDQSCQLINVTQSWKSALERTNVCHKGNKSILTNCTMEMMIRNSLCEMCCTSCTAKSLPATIKSKDTNLMKARERFRLIIGAMGVKEKGDSTKKGRSRIFKRKGPKRLKRKRSKRFKKKAHTDSNENKLELRQMSLLTNDIKRYTYFKPESVYALAYIACQNMLVIATPSAVLSTPLDDSSKNVLKERIGCYHVTVDDDEKLIFMATKSPMFGVSRMTTEGKDYRVIIEGSRHEKTFSISVDSKNKMMFQCTPLRLFTASYQGRDRTTLERDRAMRAMTYDSSERALYYNSGFQLKKRYLSEEKSSFLLELSHVPWKFVFCRNHIYISYFSRSGKKNHQLSIFKENDGLEEIENVYISPVTGVCICVIPEFTEA